MKSDRMNEKIGESAPRSADSNVGLIEIKELTWAMLDNSISETDLSRLEQLLNDSDGARKDYLNCIQLHTDLQDYFAEEKPAIERSPAPDPARSPILGFLNAGTLPLDIGSHAGNL